MKFACTLLCVCHSQGLFASVDGEWLEVSNNPSRSLSLKITNLDGAKALSYFFVFHNGAKINEHPAELPPVHLKNLADDCFKASIFDEHTEATALVILCKEEDKLYWVKLGTALSTPYIPEYAVFIRTQ